MWPKGFFELSSFEVVFSPLGGYPMRLAKTLCPPTHRPVFLHAIYLLLLYLSEIKLADNKAAIKEWIYLAFSGTYIYKNGNGTSTL